MAKTKAEEWKLYPQRGRDMHPGLFIEAMCAHGVGHHDGVHGCDGCCTDIPESIWSKVTKE